MSPPHSFCSYPGETNQASPALAFMGFLMHGKFCKGGFSNVSSCKTVAKFKQMKDFDIVTQENRDNKNLVSRESLEGCSHHSEAWSKLFVQMHVYFRPENQWSGTCLSLTWTPVTASVNFFFPLYSSFEPHCVWDLYILHPLMDPLVCCWHETDKVSERVLCTSLDRSSLRSIYLSEKQINHIEASIWLLFF